MLILSKKPPAPARARILDKSLWDFGALLFEIAGGERPVEVSVHNSLHVCGAGVLPVQVVGVFPDIDNEQRLDARLSARSFGVGRRFDDKLAVLSGTKSS